MKFASLEAYLGGVGAFKSIPFFFYLSLSLTEILLTVTLSASIVVNSLEPDQDRQNVGSDLDPSCLTL